MMNVVVDEISFNVGYLQTVTIVNYFMCESR